MLVDRNHSSSARLVVFRLDSLAAARALVRLMQAMLHESAARVTVALPL